MWVLKMYHAKHFPDCLRFKILFYKRFNQINSDKALVHLP